MLSGSAADAEEAAQDAFVKAWRALRRFDPQRPFRPWLLAIVANEARNRHRATGRRTRLALRAAGEQNVADHPSPELLLIAAERERALTDAIGRLDERDRQVIACRYLLELSETETAAALRWRVGTVKSRLSRALARLRDAAERDEVLHG